MILPEAANAIIARKIDTELNILICILLGFHEKTKHRNTFSLIYEKRSYILNTGPYCQ